MNKAKVKAVTQVAHLVWGFVCVCFILFCFLFHVCGFVTQIKTYHIMTGNSREIGEGDWCG